MGPNSCYETLRVRAKPIIVHPHLPSPPIQHPIHPHCPIIKRLDRRLRRLVTSSSGPQSHLPEPECSLGRGYARIVAWPEMLEMGPNSCYKTMRVRCPSRQVIQTGGYQTEPTLKSSCYNARPSRLVHSSQLLQPCSLSCQSLGAFDSDRMQRNRPF